MNGPNPAPRLGPRSRRRRTGAAAGRCAGRPRRGPCALTASRQKPEANWRPHQASWRSGSATADRPSVDVAGDRPRRRGLGAHVGRGPVHGGEAGRHSSGCVRLDWTRSAPSTGTPSAARSASGRRRPRAHQSFTAGPTPSAIIVAVARAVECAGLLLESMPEWNRPSGSGAASPRGLARGSRRS